MCMAVAHVWRSVESAVSSHLYVGSGEQTRVTRFMWQVLYPLSRGTGSDAYSVGRVTSKGPSEAGTQVAMIVGL